MCALQNYILHIKARNLNLTRQLSGRLDYRNYCLVVMYLCKLTHAVNCAGSSEFRN